jgi:hypothetical protein
MHPLLPWQAGQNSSVAERRSSLALTSTWGLATIPGQDKAIAVSGC